VAHDTLFPDGSWDFAGGVNSYSITTVRSERVPHGIRRDQISWANNAILRSGCISPRPGYTKFLDMLQSGLWQAGYMFEPLTDDFPYLVVSVAGRIYRVMLDGSNAVVDLSSKFGLTNPSTTPQAFMVEGNGILVIQAGDGVTNPLFYSTAQGEKLVRSRGIVGNSTDNTKPLNQLPAAGPMVFYQGRIWYAFGRKFTAGDIEGNQFSGTLPWDFDDSITQVTENPLAVGGDGFIVPSHAGLIRALAYTANLDTTLGQGPLYIFTRKQVYSLQVPVTRTDWIAANSNNQPVQTVAQINSGAVGEDGIVHVNGDLFYQGIEPSIRSLTVATRWYGQWGNVPISNNVNRALQFNDRSVLRRAPGVYFENRMLEGVLPKQTPQGVVCPGLLPLDFDLISTLDERQPPAWEGMWTGLDILKTFTGDFGGRDRCFAVTVSRLDQSLDVYEITQLAKNDDNGTDHDIRIDWYAEFPALTWGKEFELKKLHSAEIWIDRVFGTCEMAIDYRPDAQTCWTFWDKTEFCSARNCEENVDIPCGYPLSNVAGECYEFPIVFGEPPLDKSTCNRRPTNVGYQFQIRLRLKGFLRIRGFILYAEPRMRAVYEDLNMQQPCVSVPALGFPATSIGTLPT
jgi:hypothetical protein